MKKVLILVLSADFPPYDKMIQTSINTWDSINVEGVDTVFYCGKSDKKSTDKIVYTLVQEDLYNLGHKALSIFEWALINKDFDYIARVHSSVYVNKKELIKYIQSLPNKKVFASLEVTGGEPWCWGGIGYVISKDVIELIVENKENWNHERMEDMAMSQLVYKNGIEFTSGHGASIDKKGDGWSCLVYGGGQGFDFTNFEDVRKSGQFFYRVKQDGDRDKDEFIMTELFKALQ